MGLFSTGVNLNQEKVKGVIDNINTTKGKLTSIEETLNNAVRSITGANGFNLVEAEGVSVDPNLVTTVISGSQDNIEAVVSAINQKEELIIAYNNASGMDKAKMFFSIKAETMGEDFETGTIVLNNGTSALSNFAIPADSTGTFVGKGDSKLLDILGSGAIAVKEFLFGKPRKKSEEIADSEIVLMDEDTSKGASTGEVLDNRLRIGFENRNLDNVADYSSNTLETDTSSDEVFDQYSSDVLVADPLSNVTYETSTNTNTGNRMGMLYNQYDYADIPYDPTGRNLASSGCGFFSTLSAVSAKTGHDFSRDEIANIAANVNTRYGLGNQDRMEMTMDYLSGQYNFTVDHRVGDTVQSISELQPNQAVVFLTRSSGHFVALTGKTDNGNVIINDSDGALYNRSSFQRDRVDNTGFDLSNGEFEVDRGNHWVLTFN